MSCSTALCCVTLYCAVLCCAVLCCAVLCCAVLCCAVVPLRFACDALSSRTMMALCSFDRACREVARLQEEVRTLRGANSQLEGFLRVAQQHHKHAGAPPPPRRQPRTVAGSVTSTGSHTHAAVPLSLSFAAASEGGGGGEWVGEGEGGDLQQPAAGVQLQLVRKQLHISEARLKEADSQAVMQKAKALAVDAHVAFLRTENRRLMKRLDAGGFDSGSLASMTGGDLLVGNGTSEQTLDAARAEQLVLSIGQELQECVAERDESKTQLRALMDERDEVVKELQSRVAREAALEEQLERETTALKDDVERLTKEYTKLFDAYQATSAQLGEHLHSVAVASVVVWHATRVRSVLPHLCAPNTTDGARV